jgi:FHA domain/Transcriptional regulatory protein, C terminal
MASDSVPSLQAALLQSNLVQNERVILRTTIVKIGRSVTSPYDIVIRADDIQASREHATMTLEEGTWYIEDTSRNGTVLDGRVLIKERAPIRGNDRIQIGVSFDYTFKLIHETSQSATPVDAAPKAALAAVVAAAALPAVPPPEPQPPRLTGIWISPSAAIWRDGQRLPISLSRTEYRLLKYLSHHVGDVREYDDVITAVWGGLRDKDSLHELIYRVRRKIEPSPSAPKYLIIRSGIGVVYFPNGINPAA